VGCLLDSFIDHYNDKNHLHDLVRNHPLKVCMETEKGQFFLIVQNGVASAFEQYSMEGQNDVFTISTNYETATRILDGKIKLREAASQQLLTISGSLRTSLLLESVFYLTKQKYDNQIDSEN
jgi:hypothetical protein